jgi:hypothetical protein
VYPPETVASKVSGCFDTASLGQLTVTVGQGVDKYPQSEQGATVTDVEAFDVRPVPSLTSTVAV